MLLLASVLLAVARAEPTPAPTIPTPFPTITPAPESLCKYMTDDVGPFALDCLQDEFIKVGCSVRGKAYPTETRLNHPDEEGGQGDKQWYNAQTWGDAMNRLSNIKSLNGVDCLGEDSNQPSPSPTHEPTTKAPTPSPTGPPTSLTPSPTYAEEYGFTEIYDNDGSSPATAAETATAVEQACKDAGYARQYDMTTYIVLLQMGDFSDYYQFDPVAQDTGFPTSVCDMLADPATYKPKWSDVPEGPFLEVDITSADADDTKMFDGRVYPSWLNRGDDGAGGYGAVLQSAITPAGGRAYKLYITNLRSHSKCRERAVPTTTTLGDSPTFTEGPGWLKGEDNDGTRCKRAGNAGQDWSATAKVCNDGDSTHLRYAIANRMFAHCDAKCVYSPNYTAGSNEEYWHWLQQADPNDSCWRRRVDYVGNAFQECDVQHTDFVLQDEWNYVQLEMAMLCEDRCDYVAGFVYVAGTCLRAMQYTEFEDESGDSVFAKAVTKCATYTSRANGDAGTLASVNSKDENKAAVAVCGGDICYLGNAVASKNTASGAWLDGKQITWTNWNGGYEGATTNDGDYIALQVDGTWKYTANSHNYVALCETKMDDERADSLYEDALACRVDNENEHDTNDQLALDIASSGFTNKDSPGDLHLFVEVPKTMYDAYFTFEDSKNDAGEYNWQYGSTYWNLATPAATCADSNIYESAIPWTVFNLGGAGGVKRMDKWTDETDTEQTTTDEQGLDGSNQKYIFASTIMIKAKQPLQVSVDTEVQNPVHHLRTATFTREIVARVPFVLQFQKTVTVATEVDIVSTKFNYKTVAAIIRSIQYETQYFEPPYAKIMVQIRTKSQYPYLFNKNDGMTKLYPQHANGNTNENINMTIEWLMDDDNCTFTNPDHMREGDVCTQEWMLYLTPNDNVCYATGEYTIEYTAGCFYGKDVCYLPKDLNDNDIDTVSFTFKIQTSKFCPRVADEVDLSGTLSVTGRQSFKPAEENLEDDTDGSMYLQGETIYLFATTHSDRAVITETKVIMVELVQDLSQLVMTGYNRVPFDDNSKDLTVWTEDQPSRVADGTVTINDGEDSTSVILMTDADVFKTGDTEKTVTFGAKEAGFKILLHARAFPVNVDSFGVKTLVATLEVTYQALTGLTRRRLLATNPNTDLNTRTSLNVGAFRTGLKPETLLNDNMVTLEMQLTVFSQITRQNAKGFVDSFRDALVRGINLFATDSVLYEDQCVVHEVKSDGHKIWSRPLSGGLKSQSYSRRLLTSAPKRQTLTVTFSFHPSGYERAMPLNAILSNFDRQMRLPASELLHQPIFYGAVIHKVDAVENVDFARPVGPVYTVGDERFASSASVLTAAAALCSVAFALLW